MPNGDVFGDPNYTSPFKIWDPDHKRLEHLALNATRDITIRHTGMDLDGRFVYEMILMALTMAVKSATDEQMRYNTSMEVEALIPVPRSPENNPPASPMQVSPPEPWKPAVRVDAAEETISQVRRMLRKLGW